MPGRTCTCSSNELIVSVAIGTPGTQPAHHFGKFPGGVLALNYLRHLSEKILRFLCDSSSKNGLATTSPRWGPLMMRVSAYFLSVRVPMNLLPR